MDEKDFERKMGERGPRVQGARADPEADAGERPPFAPSVSRDSNMVAGRDVNINKRETVCTVVQPGPENITPKRAAVLKDLVRMAANRDLASELSHTSAMGKWRTALRRNYDVPSYRRISSDVGYDVSACTKQQVASVRSRLRRIDNPSCRAEYNAAIYARARELRLYKGQVYATVHDRLGKRVTSLKQIGERNLKMLHNIVMALNLRLYASASQPKLIV